MFFILVFFTLRIVNSCDRYGNRSPYNYIGRKKDELPPCLPAMTGITKKVSYRRLRSIGYL